jgi:hypothetical protein
MMKSTIIATAVLALVLAGTQATADSFNRSVRGLFFAKPGMTLGRREARVRSQAEYFSSAFPADSQFVENVMWMDSKVVFVTANIPGGSNNDTTPWSAPYSNGAAQAQQVSERDGANLRWLQDAFAVARWAHAKSAAQSDDIRCRHGSPGTGDDAA